MIAFQDLLDLCEVYNPNAEFVIFNKNTRTVLGTARGFDQAKSKATAIRKQRGLTFDDVSFMTSKRFYGKTSTAPSGGRRIEYALGISQAKEGTSGAPGTLRGTMLIMTSYFKSKKRTPNGVLEIYYSIHGDNCILPI